MVKWLLTAFRWLLTGAQIKFVLFTLVAMLFTLLMSLVVPNVADFVSPNFLNSAFSSVDGRVWYFINLMDLFGGLNIILSAWIARFIIRRLPFIG